MKKRYIPFSNGSEFWSWYSDNCEICKKNIKGKEKENCCPMEYEITIADITSGDIPYKEAKMIGGKFVHQKKPAGNFVHLNKKCNEFLKIVND